MYLKDLTLRGFKSFASATRFHFEPGITAIVGPNGSGKSNVVDAIAWVMGEQGAKSLRGANMADVVFAGSKSRPALGRAQVELTIDNSDGRLPIAYSEVTISRTMFRSGGSEYAINRQPVRLLDVQELLSDTGLGRQMHVIVGQGQLDAVLSATPVERRLFIDEAAGVAKHRKRKERALRKLETMDQNLVRVLDLTEEIRRQLRPLARQAKAAREAAGVQERVRYARSRLLAADLADSASRLEKERASLAAMRSANAESEGTARAVSLKLTEARGELTRLTALGDRVQERYRDYRELVGRFNAIADLAAERAAAAARVPLAITDDAVNIAFERAKEAQVEADQAASSAELAEQALREAQAKREQQQDVTAGLRISLGKQQSKHQQALEDYRAFEASKQRALARLEAAEQRVVTAERALDQSRARLEALPQLPPEPEAEGGGPLQRAYDAAVAQEAAARDQVEKEEKAERAATQEATRRSSQAETLARSLGQMLAGPAGAAKKPWARQVAEASKQGALGQLLSVEPGWERALEALLGAMDSARVLDPGASAEALLEGAGDSGYDGVTGMVSEGQASNGAAREQVSEHGLPALSVTSAPETLSAALEELLGLCWVSESLETASALLDSLPKGSHHVVATRDGAVLTRHSVRLPGGSGVSALRLKAEHSAAAAAAEAAQRHLKEVSKKASKARSLLLSATAARESALEQLRAFDAERAQVAGERARVSALIHAGQAESRRAEETLEAVVKSLEQSRASLKEVEAHEVPKPAPAQDFLAGGTADLEQGEALLETAREQESAARMEAHVARERARSASKNSRAFRAQAERLSGERTRQLEKESRARKVGEAATAIAQRARGGARRAAAGASECEAERDGLATRRQLSQAATERMQTELAGIEAARGGAREQLLQAEVAFASLQGTHESNQLQALEFLGLSVPSQDTLEWQSEVDDKLQGFSRQFGPHNPWEGEEAGEAVAFDRALAGESLARAERQLARLGVVNPLAVEEHAALKSRLDFLLGQVEDLGRSKADLLELIREVDAQVRESFNAAFADTAEQFKVVFEHLFPGGKGRLELTDPDDPLETGVEIYARPAGKRVTRLSLLSGGERSLAALAYLIAIFRARPSPFYVMDEVEAALDDTNLSRVLSLFQDLSLESQLLVITHQKRTMEIASALYGVSMKDGVSAVVSHKMEP